MCSLGIEPTIFALLTQCSTTESQEHYFREKSVMGQMWITGTPSQWTMFKCYICRALHNAPSTLIQHFFMAYIRKMYIMFQLLHLVTWGILSPSIFKCLMVQTHRFILYQTTASYRLQAAGMSFVLWIWMLNEVIVQGILSALSLGKFNVKPC